ncbi:unnamed protein product [Agarophyton chilense]|eukprot:gb/GEZJ01000517.1/.p1 GENE.gb/GEZJ01000517.1/~~gb/GEZJ01000517.1/.p1  ORF type:complete len:494 (-),score=55.69 gb/GEZJ01000517.1/:2499-3791(-)
MDDTPVKHVQIPPLADRQPSNPFFQPPQPTHLDPSAVGAAHISLSQYEQTLFQLQSSYFGSDATILGAQTQISPQIPAQIPIPQKQRPLRFMLFSALPYEIEAFQSEIKLAGASGFIEMIPIQSALEDATASLALGAQVVCLFATDRVHKNMLLALKACGVEVLAFRYSGVRAFLDEFAFEVGIRIARPPAHSPTSVAEYTISLLMTLNRRIHIAHNRVRDGNFRLHGLMGFELSGKTVGIIGTGQVGRRVAQILSGFGCRILAFDLIESKEVLANGGRYVSLKKLLESSHILSLHAPLMAATRHMISAKALESCKRGVLIVNTARGALVDISAVIDGLRSGQVGGLAMDVYEGETSMFFRDQTGDVVDMNLQVLKSMPNVLLTGHQSALTREAITSVARNLVRCLIQFRMGVEMDFEVKPEVDPPQGLT